MKNQEARKRRKRSIRGKISGTAERPRLTVFRTAKHMYAQLVDDLSGTTIAAASTVSKELRGGEGPKVEAAKRVGNAIAVACKSKGIERVVFDRNGFLYHGRIKALADAARAAGLTF